jgi:ADP-ribosylglycohydrolase
MSTHGDSSYKTITEAVRKENSESQSNSSLMRIMPLAVWAHKLSEDHMIEAVIQDVFLTQCHPAIVESTVAYCRCIKSLIASPQNRAQAIVDTK